jgi:P-type Ca2+ transporter type 2C
MTFLGLFGIEDPLRPDVKDAVSKCLSAGVTVRMVTGDDTDIGVAIAKGCGILKAGY